MVTLTPDQEAIARAFLVPPYKVKVRAGHNVGKTFLFAALANWWFDTRNPSVVITTAPTHRDVCDLLWTEIRLQRARVNLPAHFIGPAAPEMRTSPDHWAKGYTASKGESFQGRHRSNMLFLFDEDEGLDQLYYQRTKMMFQAGAGHAWGSIGNPYTTSSASYLEELVSDDKGNPSWNLFSLSCLTHPNVLAELAGLARPVPNAVTLDQVNAAVAEQCEYVGSSRSRPGDIEWPPGSGKWHRPGPLFEAGVLGRRPTQGTDAVWSESAFDAAAVARLPVGLNELPVIGCDVARYGDDWTAIHTRIGPASLAHESGNGWSIDKTAGRLVELANLWADDFSKSRTDRRALRPDEVEIRVDDDGVGGGVVDILRAQRYKVIPVSGASTPHDKQKCPNRRSELWFDTAYRAGCGLISFSALPKTTLARLRQQALSPKYKVDGAGRRVVERKEDTKERIGRSPDDMDAVNLAYANEFDIGPTTVAGVSRSRDR